MIHDPDNLVRLEDTRTCSGCGERKLVSEFSKGGQYRNCRPCTAAYAKEWRARDGNLDRVREGQRRTYARHSQKYGIRMLKTKFGVTEDDFNSMFERQAGRCACCGRHQTEFKRRLSVDHDHQTGVVRGLLCSGCNTAIGQVRENTDVLKSMIDYLQNARAQQLVDIA
jgi:hypothetical protein